MTVAELLQELSRLPAHAEVRVSMAVVPCEKCGNEITPAPESEAQTLDRVRYEGQFVGLYA